MSETDTVDGGAADTPTDVEEVDEGDDDEAILVTAAVQIRGHRWSSDVYFRDEPDDAQLAEELVNVLTAVSVMRGNNVWFEVQRLMRGGV